MFFTSSIIAFLDPIFALNSLFMKFARIPFPHCTDQAMSLGVMDWRVGSTLGNLSARFRTTPASPLAVIGTISYPEISYRDFVSVVW